MLSVKSVYPDLGKDKNVQTTKLLYYEETRNYFCRVAPEESIHRE